MCVLLLSHWFVFIHLFVKTQRHCTLTNEIWRHVINGDFVDKPKIAISNFATEILRVSPKAPFYWKLLKIDIYTLRVCPCSAQTACILDILLHKELKEWSLLGGSEHTYTWSKQKNLDLWFVSRIGPWRLEYKSTNGAQED